MSCLHKKKLICFQNCFGVRPQVCQVQYGKTFPHFKHLHWQHKTVTASELPASYEYRKTDIYIYIAGLHPRSPCHFAWQPSARVSQTLPPSYPSHVTAAATLSDQYWHPHRSDCSNTLILAHTTSRTLQTCDISLDSLTIPAPEAGDFLELILLCILRILHTTGLHVCHKLSIYCLFLVSTGLEGI